MQASGDGSGSRVALPVQVDGSHDHRLEDPDIAGRYTLTARLLHAVLGVTLMLTFCVGLYMVGLQLSPWKLKLYNWHKWTGIAILLLSLVRLAWRLTHRVPQAVPMPVWQLRAAHVTHGLLYALFFVVPLAGWIYSSAAGFPVVFLGVFPLPSLMATDVEFAERIKPLHGWLAWTLAVLAAMHMLAALKHHFVDRDRLLARMGFGKARNA